jgi:Mn2+/Fe2+ NRAMP family transporter
LLLGVVFSLLQLKPIQVITFAQIANGALLPIVALFLIWIVNKKEVMDRHRNGWIQNALSILIVLVAITLGIKGVLGAVG